MLNLTDRAADKVKEIQDAEGLAGHSAFPERGVSAVHRLLAYLEKAPTGAGRVVELDGRSVELHGEFVDLALEPPRVAGGELPDARVVDLLE